MHSFLDLSLFVCITIKKIIHMHCRSQGTGTGFIGRMKLNGKFTFVLMTNNHVFGDEDTAQGSCIEFQFLPHQPIYLSELIEEGQFFWTNPKKEVCSVCI